MDLATVDLGRFDAESDTRLIDYFVETGAAWSVSHGKQLVLGRKGSGKTALFVHLKEKLDATVVDLDLNEYLFSTHKTLREVGVAESSAYTSAWKLLIYVAMLASVRHKLSGPEGAKFDQIVADFQFADKRGRLSQLLSWLKRIKRVDLPNVGDLASLGGIELADGPDQFIGAEFIASLVELEALARTVMVREPITVLIDRIDDVWNGSDEARHLIAGALKAMRSINLHPRKAESATVILFLRTDLWQQVSFNDRNKMSQDIEYLLWSDDELVAVIEARIQSSSGDSGAKWNSVFFDGEMRQRARSTTYVLKRTMGRPRDIVAYSTFALEEARRNRHDLVLADDIYASESRYSRHILDELTDEIASSVPEFPKVLSTLKALGKRSFNWEDWFSRAQTQGLAKNDAESALAQLFEASVVGLLEVGGGGGGSRSRYRYQDNYLQPREGALMQVHLAVTKELGLKDS